MGLRPYQQTAVENVLQEWERVRSTLVVAATGTGKTRLACELVRRRRERGRTLWIAHREELIEQAARDLERHGNLSTEIEKGDRFASVDGGIFGCSDVVVASVMSLHEKRRRRFHPHDFETIVVDEAHHATAASYRDILEYFSTAKVVGLTATPKRGDDVALGHVFDSEAFRLDIRDAQRGGWLVPVVRHRMQMAGVDISDVKSARGDLVGKQLEDQLKDEEHLHEVARPLAEMVEQSGRKTLAFVPGRAYALGENPDDPEDPGFLDILVRYLGAHAVRYVDGNTPAELRVEYLNDFAHGDVKVLINIGVLTEGYDAPAASCIALIRPTQSEALMGQMIGRGTRTLPGVLEGLEEAEPEQRQTAIAASDKPDCWLLDFVPEKHGKHKLVTPADVLAGKPLPDDVRKDVEEQESQGVPVEVALQRAEEAAERRRQKEAEEQARREREEKRRAEIRAKVAYTYQTDDPFAVDEHGPDEQPATKKQIEALKKWGVKVDRVPSKQGASKRLSQLHFRCRVKNLATPKQAKVLRRAGLRHEDVTKSEASWVIDQLQANGWKAPAEVQRRFGVERQGAPVPEGEADAAE